MYFNHLLLALLWIMYCVLHSVLAATKVKLFLKKHTGKFYRYYRLAYSIFAAITLLIILYFQYSFQTKVLIQSQLLKYVSAVLLVLPGVLLMMTSIFKYFKLLSGIRSLYQPSPPAHLKLEGIHKYIRHPLYLGTLLFIWGLLLIFPLLNNVVAVLIITIYIWIGIQFEEKKLINEFGSVYADYIKRVPKLIPRF